MYLLIYNPPLLCKLRGRCQIKYDKEINKKKKKNKLLSTPKPLLKTIFFLVSEMVFIKELISTTKKKLLVIILLWANDCFVVNGDDEFFFSLKVNMFFLYLENILEKPVRSIVYPLFNSLCYFFCLDIFALLLIKKMMQVKQKE